MEKNFENRKVVIRVENLYKSFGENHVLNDFSMELYEGENLVVLGKSGSGKSVLIKCIIGLMSPDKGSITVLDQNIVDMKGIELDKIRAQVGFLFQSNALYDSMTIRENLEFPLRRHWIENLKGEANNRVMAALESVGLSHTVDMMPSELSGGMRKRIALARTLILRPKIIMYDEPTTGLDPITGKEISNLMVEIQKQYQTSSIIISHDMSCVKIVSNRVIVLIDGRCYAVDTFENLKKSNDAQLKQYFE